MLATNLEDPFSRITQVSQYQKGKTNLDFTEARDSEWQWNPLGHMQWCIGGYTRVYGVYKPPGFF